MSTDLEYVRGEVSPDEFHGSLERLVGKECWGFIAGVGTGWVLSIDFGEKIPRGKPLRNPNLTPAQRRYVGEMSLYIESPWRIEKEVEVVAGSSDDNRPGGVMLSGLGLLVGKRVVRATAELPAYDLLLEFSEGFRLRAFCASTDPEAAFDNYSVFEGRSSVTVGPRGVLTKEEPVLNGNGE